MDSEPTIIRMSLADYTFKLLPLMHQWCDGCDAHKIRQHFGIMLSSPFGHMDEHQSEVCIYVVDQQQFQWAKLRHGF